MARTVRRFRTILKWAALGLVVLLLAIQLVPYGRDHTNPPGGRQVAWDSPRTDQLMTDACMDCHSNATKWPWYTKVAPISWLVQKDVEAGREELNLSTGETEVEEMIETIREGSMPPWQYKPTHPGARLSDQEKQDLIRSECQSVSPFISGWDRTARSASAWGGEPNACQDLV